MSEPRDLRATFDLVGEFWLPNTPETRVAGVATYSPDRITLSLTGALRDLFGELSTEEFVLGVTDGGVCTLQSLLATGSSSNSADGYELVRSQYVASHLFLGGHFANESELEFEHVSYGFEGLEEWRAESPFDVHVDSDEEGSVTTATHRFSHDAEAVELPGENASLKRDATFSRGGALWHELKWELRTGFRIEPTAPRAWPWFDVNQRDLRGLLSLLVGEPVAPTWVKAKLVGYPIAGVSIYSRFTGRHSSRQPHPSEMLLPRSKIAERWEPIVQAWFGKREILRTTTNLFFGTLYDDDWFLEFQFLALTQALETFHRQIYPGQFVDDTAYAAVYDSMISAIPAGVPTDLRAALKSRIKYGNQFSQRRRFKALLDSLPPECRALVVDAADFVGRIVDERNYLTHYDVGDGFEPMPHEELHEIVMRLRAFLTLLLLDQVGITGTEAAEALQRTRWYRGYVGG